VLTESQVLVGMNSTDAWDTLPSKPSSWLRDYTGETGNLTKVFTTTMGSGPGFKNEGIRRLLVNAVFWLTGLADFIPLENNMEFVDPYNPNNWAKLGDFKTNLTPDDFKILKPPPVSFIQIRKNFWESEKFNDPYDLTLDRNYYDILGRSMYVPRRRIILVNP